MPLLLNQVVCAEPAAFKSFLPHLLGSVKDSAQGETPELRCWLLLAPFQSQVIPVPLQLFEGHDEHTWKVLLSHLEACVEHFTQEQLKKVTSSQVLPGRHATRDSTVAVTRHSLATVVSLLGPEVIVGGGKNRLQTHCLKFDYKY